MDPWFLTNALDPLNPDLLTIDQLLAIIAPRPFLVIGANCMDGEESWPYIRSVLPVYQLLHASDRIGLFNYKAPLTFTGHQTKTFLMEWLNAKVREVRRGTLPYRLLSAGERAGLYRWKGKHSFCKPMRDVAYAWLDSWL